MATLAENFKNEMNVFCADAYDFFIYQPVQILAQFILDYFYYIVPIFLTFLLAFVFGFLFRSFIRPIAFSSVAVFALLYYFAEKLDVAEAILFLIVPAVLVGFLLDYLIDRYSDVR